MIATAACRRFRFWTRTASRTPTGATSARSIRTIQANIELTAVEPQLNLYDDHWPVRTYQPNLPPPKFVFNSNDRCGAAHDSIVCAGAIISGGQVTRTIVGPQTRVNSYAEVEDSILFSRREHRPAGEDPPGDHRQGRARSPRASASASTRRRTWPAASP